MIRSATLACCYSLALSGVIGCSDSTTVGTSPQPFTSFSEIPANGATQLEGVGVSTSYVQDPATGGFNFFAESGPGASSAQVTTSGGQAVELRASTPGSNVVFNAGRGDTATPVAGVVVYRSVDGASRGVFANQAAQGYEYQTYGAWLTGVGTGVGTVGAGSYGAQTDPATIPAGRTATYSGKALGVVRRSDAQVYTTESNVNVSTDFSTVNISSSGTRSVNLLTNVPGSASDLDFSGSGPVSGSAFAANVSGPATSGSATGAFYGPNASEVGGTFRTTGAGGLQHMGAFGGN